MKVKVKVKDILITNEVPVGKLLLRAEVTRHQKVEQGPQLRHSVLNNWFFFRLPLWIHRAVPSESIFLLIKGSALLLLFIFVIRVSGNAERWHYLSLIYSDPFSLIDLVTESKCLSSKLLGTSWLADGVGKGPKFGSSKTSQDPKKCFMLAWIGVPESISRCLDSSLRMAMAVLDFVFLITWPSSSTRYSSGMPLNTSISLRTMS